MPSRRIYLLPLKKAKQVAGPIDDNAYEMLHSILNNTGSIRDMLSPIVKFNETRLHIGTLAALTEYVFLC